MNGSTSIRGYLLQTIICLLDVLQSDSKWKSLTLEPDLSSEKVDIIWYYVDPNEIRVSQVKSSQNQINKAQAMKWAKELASSTQASSYELILIGPCAQSVVDLRNVGKVEIPHPKSLDVSGLIEQAAHRLDIHFENRNKARVSAATREMLAKALVTELETYSTGSVLLSRDAFEQLLDKWVQDALGKEEKPSLEQLRILKEKINKLVEKTPYIRTLHIDHSKAVQWRGATQRHMRELDEVLPGDSFEKRRAKVPWHEPTERSTEKDYQRGCDITRGLLEDALQKLQEKLDSMQ